MIIWHSRRYRTVYQSLITDNKSLFLHVR